MGKTNKDPIAPVLEDGFPNPASLDVWEYMQKLTEMQWQSHVGYLYRTNPTVARIDGKPGYLDKFVAPISEEGIAAKYGGYEYRLDLNRNGKGVYRVRFAIEAPPLMQAGETVAAKPEAPSDAAGKGRVPGGCSTFPLPIRYPPNLLTPPATLVHYPAPHG